MVNYTAASLPAASTPIEPNPFGVTVFVRGSSLTWYVPIIYLGRGSTSQMYVNYVCLECDLANASFDFLRINLQQPQSFSIDDQGQISNTTGISFSVPSVAQLGNDSETVLYTLSVPVGSAGFYSFSLPFGWAPEPVLYVKTTTTNYGPILNFVKSFKAQTPGCFEDYEVTILGFTNSYYTEVPLVINSAS